MSDERAERNYERTQRQQIRAEMNNERVLREERARRAINRERKRARASEFMQEQEAAEREAEDAAREAEDAAREAEAERIFAAKKTAEAKASLQASIDTAQAKKHDEMTKALEIKDTASRKKSTIERESFTLLKENCNADSRNVVVLPVPRGKKWYATNISFFQTSATSNGASFSHLRNTYLPTLGVLDASESVPGLEPLQGEGDVIIKTGLFKSIFAGKIPKSTMGEQPIPVWIDELLTDYCSLYYPHLIVRDFTRLIVDKEDYYASNAMFDSLQEIYQLFDLCMYYFSDVWQMAMSIGLGRFTNSGVWVEKFRNFASFIDTKMIYTIGGYNGNFGIMPLREFLITQNAQSSFDFKPLATVIIRGSKYFLFTGRSVQSLGVPLRIYQSQHRSGGTRRRKSVKTRRQKRR